MTEPDRWPVAVWIAAGALFVLVATANGGGYRYGSSDQAFYIPAVQRALEPAAFPRDASLIDAQARLIVVDDVLAATVRATRAPIEWLFFTAYLISLAVIWTGLVLVGSGVYRSPWTTLALGAAFTMRHQIARTSANSFEPYFHPRMLAFGIGMLAIAALLRRQSWLAVLLVGASAIIHVTTAIWFAALIGVALAILDRRWRALVGAGAVLATAFVAWAAIAGPLQHSWVTMDATWLQALATKDTLLANQWPLWAWAINIGTVVALLWAHLTRQRRGEARPEDAALVWGTTAMVALFLATLPAVASHLALFVEFQISRVFWLADFIATVYLLAAFADTGARRGRPRLPAIVASVLMAVSIGRAFYVTLVEHPERPLMAIHTPASPWEDAMHWIAKQPLGVHVLADPGHAWKYGTSVRVSGGRDVFLEEVKDAALAIYSRDVAVRVVERTQALGNFSELSVGRAQDLARKYDLDYLITEADLTLPLAYRNQQFRIYVLKEHGAP